MRLSRRAWGCLAAALLVLPAGTALAAPLPRPALLQAQNTASATSGSPGGAAKSTQSAAGHSNLLPSKSKKSSSKRKRRPKGQMAPTADRITEIQQSLSRAGYYQGEPTGKWDASTVDAMKRFQQDKGLSPTGKIDALTLQKLGLGSDIAGVDAPQATPPPGTPPAGSPPRP